VRLTIWGTFHFAHRFPEGYGERSEAFGSAQIEGLRFSDGKSRSKRQRRWNRVLVGSFGSRDEALRFAAEFNRKEHMEGWSFVNPIDPHVGWM